MADLLNTFGGYENNSLINTFNNINNQNLNAEYIDSFIDSVFVDREQIRSLFKKFTTFSFKP